MEGRTVGTLFGVNEIGRTVRGADNGDGLGIIFGELDSTMGSNEGVSDSTVLGFVEGVSDGRVWGVSEGVTLGASVE